MPIPHVIVRDLWKRYGQTEAVRGVTFSIERGEVFGLLGPNGAGKTSTLECLVGLREPDSGELEVCGLDARRYPKAVKQKIGVTLQSTALQDKITPREALRLFGSFYPERATPEALIARFNLTDKADASFDSLSGGQRQRLALALAFVNRPELVFLDEPTSGLDPQSRRELHGEIHRMKEEGCTVLLTTHYLEEAERLCDRIAIVDQGRIVAAGVPRELISQSSGLQTVTLITSRPLELEAIARVAGVSDVHVDGTQARFRVADASRALAELARLASEQQTEIQELHLRKASLEDVFLRLTETEGSQK